jgi:heat shock protein HslJ
VVCLLTGVVLASCTQNPDVDTRSATQGLPNTKVDLVAGAWRLDSAASMPKLGSVAADATEPTLDFHADGTVSGRGPCNTFRGSFEVDDDAVTISKIQMTTMACEDAVMDDETVFHEALADVDHVKFSADHHTLTLTGGDGTRLVFASYDPYE